MDINLRKEILLDGQNINLPERKNHDELNTGPKRHP